MYKYMQLWDLYTCIQHIDAGTHSALGNVYAKFYLDWFTRLERNWEHTNMHTYAMIIIV